MTRPSMTTARRNQYVTTAMVFVVFTGFAFVLPFLTLFVRELGVATVEGATTWAGVLIGVAPLLAGLMAPVWGRLAEKHGHKPMAIRALLSYVVLLVLSALVTNVWQLFALRAGIGLFGGIGPLGLAMATAHAPREETGRAVGLVQAAQILSAAVGPLLGGFIADSVGTRAAFLFTAGFCLVALGLVWAFYEEAPSMTAHKSQAGGSSLWDLARIPRVLPMLVVLFLVNFIGRSFTPILAPHLHELGVASGRLAMATGLLISIYSVAAALSAAGLGRATRTRSPWTLLLFSLAGGAACVLPMAFARSLGQILFLGLCLGLVSGGALTLSLTIGGLLVPADRRTSAFGMFSGANLLGGAVAPAVAGALAHLDLKAIYFVDAALFASLASALAVWRRAIAPARAEAH